MAALEQVDSLNELPFCSCKSATHLLSGLEESWVVTASGAAEDVDGVG